LNPALALVYFFDLEFLPSPFALETTM